MSNIERYINKKIIFHKTKYKIQDEFNIYGFDIGTISHEIAHLIISSYPNYPNLGFEFLDESNQTTTHNNIKYDKLMLDEYLALSITPQIYTYIKKCYKDEFKYGKIVDEYVEYLYKTRENFNINIENPSVRSIVRNRLKNNKMNKIFKVLYNEYEK